MNLPEPGTARHSLAVLGAVAVVGESALTLVGGWAGATASAVVIVVAAVVTARYVGGAASEDAGPRGRTRMLEESRAGLGDWRYVVRLALADDGSFPAELRRRVQRLYDARLSDRHGLSLHRDPERAAALLGPEVWSWLDPTRSETPPLTPALLRAAADRLQQL